MSDIGNIMRVSPVIPVVTIPDKTDVIALGHALLHGGVRIIEVTLRTQGALAAIVELVKTFPEMRVGAGTVWADEQARAVIDSGVAFVVSPGISMPVHEVCTAASVPLLPGAQTISEMAHWHSVGQEAVKFFPASASGGVAALKAYSSVLPALEFCPTGGINMSNVREYLDLPSVPCVGGSWVVPESALRDAAWASIEESAKKVSEL